MSPPGERNGPEGKAGAGTSPPGHCLVQLQADVTIISCPMTVAQMSLCEMSWWGGVSSGTHGWGEAGGENREARGSPGAAHPLA